jgi:outer membrane protein TolC
VTVDGADLLQDDLDRAQTVAAQVALANRLELMNARAQVVDAWRRIAVQANSLLGVANVGYNFTTPSDTNQPFVLGGNRSTHQLVLSGELPLVRRAERNAYRAALITYQRARRNLQATEDFILNDVRTDLRSQRVLAENYRIQQRAVEVAYDQVENSLDVLQSPPEGGGALRPAGQGAANAGNAAALTNQLLSAQNSLVAAQNGLYTVWVNYLIARMTLYRDIERLPLDLRGVWIDESCPPPAPADQLLPAPHPVGGAGDGPEPERFADGRPPGDR